MAGWVDAHCHLHLSEESPAVLLDRAAAAGVGWLVNPGTDAASSEEAFRLAEQFPGRVFPTAGLHPHDAARWQDERGRIERLAAQAVAVGECGLDFYRNLSAPEVQIEAFRDQVRLAVDLGKPLVVHCRDAFSEMFDLIEGSGAGPGVVLHCWTGGPRWTRRFRDLGVTFSFAGPVTFETGDTVRRGAAQAQPDQVMVETDTPYLTPPPHRDAPNEPANVARVGEALAAVWGLPVDEVAALTTATATRVFRGG
ncbi:MAG: TatD family hydrolase [Actinomycetota bacterium]